MNELQAFRLVLKLEREAVRRIVSGLLAEAYALGLEGRRFTNEWVEAALARLDHPLDQVAKEE